jgi:hypothetical protein
VPVKWRLSDGRSGYLSDLATFKSLTSQASSCVSGTPASEIEEVSTTGNSGLHFDESTNEFVFVWKTSSSWKNRCRTLILELADGQRHFASFQFQ